MKKRDRSAVSKRTKLKPKYPTTEPIAYMVEVKQQQVKPQTPTFFDLLRKNYPEWDRTVTLLVKSAGISVKDYKRVMKMELEQLQNAAKSGDRSAQLVLEKLECFYNELGRKEEEKAKKEEEQRRKKEEEYYLLHPRPYQPVHFFRSLLTFLNPVELFGNISYSSGSWWERIWDGVSEHFRSFFMPCAQHSTCEYRRISSYEQMLRDRARRPPPPRWTPTYR